MPAACHKAVDIRLISRSSFTRVQATKIPLNISNTDSGYVSPFTKLEVDAHANQQQTKHGSGLAPFRQESIDAITTTALTRTKTMNGSQNMFNDILEQVRNGCLLFLTTVEQYI